MRRTWPAAAAAAFSLGLALACGSSSSSPQDGSSSGTASSSGFGTSSSSSGGLIAQGCADGTTLVYVVSDAGDLYSFDPDSVAFTKKGAINCPGETTATVNSMAVDRTGIAWVNYSDGALFRVSITNAACAATAYVVGQGGFHRVGMAFATDGAGSSVESLYVGGGDTVGAPSGGGLGLAKIDTTTLKLLTLGNYSSPLTGRSAELTGTGEGKLYGFFDTNPASLAEIAPTTAATTNTASLSNVNTGNAFAFSAWRGDFYFYTSQVGDRASKVQRYKPSTKVTETVLANVGNFRIVGAGVSTCAPTSAPR